MATSFLCRQVEQGHRSLGYVFDNDVRERYPPTFGIWTSVPSAPSTEIVDSWWYTLGIPLHWLVQRLRSIIAMLLERALSQCAGTKWCTRLLAFMKERKDGKTGSCWTESPVKTIAEEAKRQSIPLTQSK